VKPIDPMSTTVSYRDIPRAERRRLGKEVFCQPRWFLSLFALYFVSLLLANFLCGYIAPSPGLFSKAGPILENLAARIMITLVPVAVIWETMGRRRFNAAVEKLKNA
jgi:phosphatidylglycerophosphate synthase